MVCSAEIQNLFEKERHYKAKIWVPAFEGSIKTDITELLKRSIGIHIFSRPLITIATCISLVYPKIGLHKWFPDIVKD